MAAKLPKRLTALLGAILFLLNTAGEGFGYSGCPFQGAGGDHGAHHSVPQQQAPRQDAPPAHDRAAGHGHAGHGDRAVLDAHEAAKGDHHAGHQPQQGHGSHGSAAHLEPHGPTPAEGGAEICTHMEICQAATGAMLPLGLDTGTVTARTTNYTERSLPEERVASSHLPFFLPYAQAPPARG